MSTLTIIRTIELNIKRCERNINTVRVHRKSNAYRDLSDDYKAYIDARSLEFVHLEVIVLRQYKKKLKGLTQ